MRRVCEGGIAYGRGLRAREWQGRKAHIERYFIKQWTDAEWTVANYGNVIRVIEEHYTQRKREVPVSFLYKYATALERVGRIEDCKKVLAEGKERVRDKESETYYLLLLAEGDLSGETGMFKESLAVLDMIRPEVLSPASHARLFVRYIFNFLELGDEEGYGEFVKKADKLPHEAGLVDQLLRVEYTKIGRMLDQGIYTPTKPMIRRGIRLAVRHKAYRSMCSMYMIASALYYEQGDYPRTLKFLDRTIQIAKNTNTPNWVYEYTVRYAYIYRKLGFYGNAIEKAEGVVRAVHGDPAYHRPYFASLTALFMLLTLINSPRAEEIRPELTSAAECVQAQNPLAFYHQALGRYYAKCGELSRALNEFERARNMFSIIRLQDDEVGACLAIASVLVTDQRLDEARKLLTDIRRAVEVTELEDLRAKYLTVQLKYRKESGATKQMIQECMDRCEKIRPLIRDFDAVHKLDAELFSSAIAIADHSRAFTAFDHCYKHVRHIVGNLSADYVADYVKDPDLVTMIEKYRSLKT
jgi:tetratricopeptide (TPR) repeat protein